jgi:predicted transcriptional regulator
MKLWVESRAWVYLSSNSEAVGGAAGAAAIAAVQVKRIVMN